MLARVCCGPEIVSVIRAFGIRVLGFVFGSFALFLLAAFGSKLITPGQPAFHYAAESLGVVAALLTLRFAGEILTMRILHTMDVVLNTGQDFALAMDVPIGLVKGWVVFGWPRFSRGHHELAASLLSTRSPDIGSGGSGSPQLVGVDGRTTCEFLRLPRQNDETILQITGNARTRPGVDILVSVTVIAKVRPPI